MLSSRRLVGLVALSLGLLLPSGMEAGSRRARAPETHDRSRPSPPTPATPAPGPSFQAQVTPEGAIRLQVTSRAPGFLRVQLRAVGSEGEGLDHRDLVPAGGRSFRFTPPVPDLYEWSAEFETLAFAPPVPLGARGTGPGHYRGPTFLGLTLDQDLVVADRGNRRVQVLTPEGRHRLTLRLGDLSGGSAYEPAGVTLTSSGRLVVADAMEGTLRLFSGVGRPLGNLGSEPPGPRPGGLDRIRDRELILALPRQDRVVHLGSSGRVLRSLGGFGTAPGRLRGPEDVAAAGDDRFWVSESGNRRVQLFHISGGSEKSLNGSLERPHGLAVDSRGLVYVADRGTRSVHVLHPDLGEVLVLGGAASPFREPWDVAAPPSGSLLVSDRRGNVVWFLASRASVFYKNGQVSTTSVR